MFVAPHPSPTPCSVPVPHSVNITWPSTKLAISRNSILNFERFTDQVHGLVWVIVKLNGTKTALIAPSRDIDAERRATLAAYADKISVSPTVACGRAAAVFLMLFEVPSGAVHYVVVPEPDPKYDRVQVPTPPPPP